MDLDDWADKREPQLTAASVSSENKNELTRSFNEPDDKKKDTEPVTANKEADAAEEEATVKRRRRRRETEKNMESVALGCERPASKQQWPIV